ncbi:MAG TPA: hypothetical protein VIE42_07230 [Steroidobacteraceae bacterium]
MVLNRMYRITTFVPPEHLDALLEGVGRETPLQYGQYEQSAWWSAVGVEQFRPMPGAKPTCGEVGRTERVPTVRVEFAIPRDPDLLVRVLTRGLIPHHPWEQPAIFIDESQATISHTRED